ncbi:unnamed protein product [Linum trigynum]|uniref:DNA-binding domain-containing protein n=1 Tax=Linum trigynum TaxID=586398 RepID=A0AAV2G6I0_9ROSI
MVLKHRFRLSNMIPNGWFYKLKDMSKSRPTTLHRHQQHSSKEKPSAAAATRAPQLPRYSYLSAKPARATNQHHYHHHKLYNSPVNHKASDTQHHAPKSN